jgi:hypothetical protein
MWEYNITPSEDGNTLNYEYTCAEPLRFDYSNSSLPVPTETPIIMYNPRTQQQLTNSSTTTDMSPEYYRASGSSNKTYEYTPISKL